MKHLLIFLYIMISIAAFGQGKKIRIKAYVNSAIQYDTFRFYNAIADTAASIRADIPAEINQDISTTGAPGNISISSGSALNLNVYDGDSSRWNEIDSFKMHLTKRNTYDRAYLGYQVRTMQDVGYLAALEREIYLYPEAATNSYTQYIYFDDAFTRQHLD